MHFPLWPRISHISNIFDHKNKGTVALEPVAPSGARRSSDVYLLRRLSRGNNSAEVSFSSELAPSQGYTFCIPATLLHAHPSPLFSLFPLTLLSLLISPTPLHTFCGLLCFKNSYPTSCSYRRAGYGQEAENKIM